MTVLVHSQGADWNQELYRQTVDRVIPDRANPPAGLLAHIGAPGKAGGRQVVDVWESEDAFRRFLEDTLIPAAKEIGAPPFATTVVEVDNTLIP
ncbi:hypothetical protein [Streptomyces sp. CC208A]|uniref:hypothetical protein n=1 Tax=Streptomyces sp. CC208A TaxID=3044573 RepID=UPI0024A8DE5A|nr:hypothetical protein [Streptomyces sp. CC208A]